MNFVKNNIFFLVFMLFDYLKLYFGKKLFKTRHLFYVDGQYFMFLYPNKKYGKTINTVTTKTNCKTMRNM